MNRPITDTASIPESKLFVDLRGKRLNSWTVFGYAGQNSRGQSFWHCICECGNIKTIIGWVLTSGGSKTCGSCRTRIGNRKHGMSRTPEHRAWKAMKSRCFNENNKEWKYYGGRGITVADEWIDDFPTFFKHVGPRPSSIHSLDRINVNGNYEPGNVQWANKTQQSRNRRSAVFVTMSGVSMHLADAVKIAPVRMSSYRRRLKNGWDKDVAISTPPRQGLRSTSVE